MLVVLYNSGNITLIKVGKMSKTVIDYLPLMIFLLVTLAYRQLEANAQSFLPVGPQTNVPVDTVTGGGWTECYRDIYNINMDADTVLASCPGDLLMLSCRPTGSDTLTLLAQGARSCQAPGKRSKF